MIRSEFDYKKIVPTIVCAYGGIALLVIAIIPEIITEHGGDPWVIAMLLPISFIGKWIETRIQRIQIDKGKLIFSYPIPRNRHSLRYNLLTRQHPFDYNPSDTYTLSDFDGLYTRNVSHRWLLSPTIILTRKGKVAATIIDYQYKNKKEIIKGLKGIPRKGAFPKKDITTRILLTLGLRNMLRSLEYQPVSSTRKN